MVIDSDFIVLVCICNHHHIWNPLHLSVRKATYLYAKFSLGRDMPMPEQMALMGQVVARVVTLGRSRSV